MPSFIEELTHKHSDLTQDTPRLDFMEQAVRSVEAALVTAYHAGGQIRVRFARKPLSLADVVAAASDGSNGPHIVQIQGHQRLSSAEYQAFLTQPCRDYPWLEGKGGWINEKTRQAIKVTCAGQPTLFVDPSGSAYARYVGIEV
jgi:hypothetical protein